MIHTGIILISYYLIRKIKVIAYGNPFDHINVKEIYKELELLK